MNVFRTFSSYKKQFQKFLRIATGGGKVFYFEGDPVLGDVVDKSHWSLMKIPYGEHPHTIEDKRFLLKTKDGSIPLYLIGAHTPYSVEATINAFRQTYAGHRLVTCLELHTYSSLNQEYLPLYEGSLRESDQAMVYYNPSVVKNKKLPGLSQDVVKEYFGKKELEVYNDSSLLADDLRQLKENTLVLLLLTTGNFSGLDLNKLAAQVANR